MPKISDEILLQRAAEVHFQKFSYGPFVRSASGRGQLFTVVCPTHGEFLQPVAAHLAGKGCKACAMETLVEKKKHTLESVTAKTAEFGWNYEYTKLEFFSGSGLQPVVHYTCPTHGPIVQNLYNHLSGKGCHSCKSGKLRDSLPVFSEKASKVHAGKYVYSELVHGIGTPSGGSTVLVSVICPEHGEFTQGANTHMSGHGCPECGEIAKTIKLRLTEDEVLSAWPLDGYPYVRLLASKASGKGQGVVSLCARHGEFEQGLYARLRLGHKCPSCSGLVSSLSTTFRDALISAGLVESVDFQLEYRPEGQRRSWDLYFPGKGIAVELHGVFWHSSKYCGPSELQDKHEAGLALGFRTLHFYEDEVLENLDLCVRHTLNAIGKSADSKVFARKLKAVELTYAQAKVFLAEHHIQGPVAAKYFGLLDNGELVAAAGFAARDSGRGRKSTDTCELVRYATSCKVVGGLGKLLKFSQLQMQFKKLVSFSEVRLHSGSSYEKLGFSVEHKVKRDYMYVAGKQRKHKSGFQKSSLAKVYPGLDLTQTEKQITESLKLYRIYDCGKLKWVRAWA